MIASIEDLLVRDEGEVLHVYLDSRGIQSLGVGRRVDEKGGISKAESRYLLSNDLVQCRKDCLLFSWFYPLNPARQGVILSMRFIFGKEGLDGWPHFLNQMAQRDWLGASQNLLSSDWHKEAPARVERLAGILQTGAWA